jgi:cytochrome bd-type quinol oxidase subunit 2
MLYGYLGLPILPEPIIAMLICLQFIISGGLLAICWKNITSRLLFFVISFFSFCIVQFLFLPVIADIYLNLMMANAAKSGETYYVVVYYFPLTAILYLAICTPFTWWLYKKFRKA